MHLKLDASGLECAATDGHRLAVLHLPHLSGASAEGGDSEAEAGATPVAEKVEGLLYAHRKQQADEKYLSQLRELCAAVKDPATGLRAKLLAAGGDQAQVAVEAFLKA